MKETIVAQKLKLFLGSLVLFLGIFSYVPIVSAQFFQNSQPSAERESDMRERINRARRDSNQRSDPNEVRAAVPQHLQNRQPAQQQRQRQAPGLPQGAYVEEQRPQSGGFFNWLFGNRPAPQQEEPIQQAAPVFVDPDQVKAKFSKRTVCVRLCDGAFMPISTGRGTGRERDGELCQAQCPGAEVKVFSMNTENIEDAVSSSGESYVNLPNASKFKQSYTQGCACRPQGKTWAEHSTSLDDPTMRRGDQVLTEEQAKRMAMAPAARGVQAIQTQSEKDKANYLLRPAKEELVVEPIKIENSGSVRTIAFIREQLIEEVPDIKLSPIEVLLRDRAKRSEPERTGSIR